MAGGDIIFGRQPVMEVLKAGRREFFELTFASGMKQSPDLDTIHTMARTYAIREKEVTRSVLDSLAGDGNHQGVVLRCGGYPYCNVEEVESRLLRAEGDGIVLIVDHLQDPHNLGALLRSAEVAGVAGVILPSNRAAGVTASAVRSSAGATEHLRVARVPNLVHVIRRLKKAGVWVTGLEACEGAVPYTDIDFKGKVAVVVGSEGSGLGHLLRETCDFLAKLPVRGSVTSLNAGVAGGIILYEVLRQQGADSAKV